MFLLQISAEQAVEDLAPEMNYLNQLVTSMSEEIERESPVAAYIGGLPCDRRLTIF